VLISVIRFCWIYNSKWRTQHQPLVEEDLVVVLGLENVVGAAVEVADVVDAVAVVVVVVDVEVKRVIRNGFQ